MYGKAPHKKTQNSHLEAVLSYHKFAQDTDVFDDIRALVERVRVAVTNIEPQSGVWEGLQDGAMAITGTLANLENTTSLVTSWYKNL